MTLSITHPFASAKGDGPDTTLVQPSDWNAQHTATLGAGLVGNAGPGTGPATEIPLGAGLSFNAGTLVNTVQGLPIGVVLPVAGDYEPAGCLICDGRAISRTTYAALFAITSTLFGVGDGVTTFNIPDMRGRVPAGKDNLGGVAANRLTAATLLTGATVVGSTAGTEQHKLLATEIPTHTHTIGPTATPHKHWTVIPGDQNDASPSVSSTESIVSANTTGSFGYQLDGSTTLPTAGLTSESGTGTHTHTTAMSGTVDQPHMNLQPTITMGYVIWTGVIL